MGKQRIDKKGTADSGGAEQIVIDEQNGLVFGSEDELYAHFQKEITKLEEEFFKLRPKTDIPEANFEKYEDNLSVLLEDPDEVWEDKETFPGQVVCFYLRRFEYKPEPEKTLYHVSAVYISDNIPTFVYLHFPTIVEQLAAQYRRGEKVFDRLDQNIPFGALEGDALHEGDEFARGLYQSMLKVRAESDIKEEKFRRYADLREDTIENPDEIWRNNDTLGNVLVSFIREVSEENEPDLYYIVVTIEDSPSNSHALLFSFPTSDESLVARYRHGENLQAEEVVQEASH
jgi:hypothetical protein